MSLAENTKLKTRIQVGVFQIQEHRTHISAPNGKIIAENASKYCFT